MKTLTALATLLVSASALAGPPSMFANCKNMNIKSPPNGAGVYFDDDCTTAYVLPPLSGDIEVADPTRTTSTQLCGAINNVFSSIALQSRIANDKLKQLEHKESTVNFGSLPDPWMPQPSPAPTQNPDVTEIENLREQVTNATLKVLDYNDRISQYEGPRVKLTVIADQNQLVDEYTKLNKGITFRPMPLAKSVLSFIAKSERNVGKAPAAIAWDIAGISVTPSYFTGLKPEDGAVPATSTSQQVLFSSAVSGQLLLSLVGACPFYDAKTDSMPSTIDARALSSYFAVTGDYVYNVEVSRQYVASYNLAEMMKRIQSQSTKGGLFSSSTIHSLIVEQDSKGWFKFESKSQDPRLEWQQELSQTIKSELIARALQQLGAKPIGENESPALLPPGRHGASTIAEGLHQCPNIYCQGAAFILEGADAVFGSSNAVSNFIATNNKWESEEVTDKKMVPQFGQVRFVH